MDLQCGMSKCESGVSVGVAETQKLSDGHVGGAGVTVSSDQCLQSCCWRVAEARGLAAAGCRVALGR
jgi:hypothetical protein